MNQIFSLALLATAFMAGPVSAANLQKSSENGPKNEVNKVEPSTTTTNAVCARKTAQPKVTVTVTQYSCEATPKAEIQKQDAYSHTNNWQSTESHEAFTPANQWQNAPNQGTSVSSTSTSGGLEGFSKECLDQINYYRGVEGRKPLTWDQKLAEDAKGWATTMAQTGSFHHSDTSMGENSYEVINADSSCTAAVRAWYDEKKFYHNEKIGEGKFADYGHYTQMISSLNTNVGCGYSDTTSNGQPKRDITCRFGPGGNVAGEALL